MRNNLSPVTWLQRRVRYMTLKNLHTNCYLYVHAPRYATKDAHINVYKIIHLWKYYLAYWINNFLVFLWSRMQRVRILNCIIEIKDDSSLTGWLIPTNKTFVYLINFILTFLWVGKYHAPNLFNLVLYCERVHQW